MATTVTIVGGGLGGLVAAIAAREAGLEVEILEAQPRLGGRARSTRGPYVANWGPHALYRDGDLWRWLEARGESPPCVAPPLRHPLRYRWDGRLRQVPKPELLTALTRLRRATPPVDRRFTDWAAERAGNDAAHRLAQMAGVFTFDHDPGRCSAAFIHPRLLRVTAVPPAARFVVGGWTALIERLEHRAWALGARITTGARVSTLPDPPVILALPLDRAARLLGDASLTWPGARTALLDVAVRARRRDPYAIWDLDEASWVETFTHADPSLAPPGEHLIQAQTGLAAGEALGAGVARLEAILDRAFVDFDARQTWRRQARVTNQSGALDLPGTTWRDRPAIDRGNGVYLVGDMVAAPGLLGEVSHGAALAAVDALAGRSVEPRGRSMPA